MGGPGTQAPSRLVAGRRPSGHGRAGVWRWRARGRDRRVYSRLFGAWGTPPRWERRTVRSRRGSTAVIGCAVVRDARWMPRLGRCLASPPQRTTIAPLPWTRVDSSCVWPRTTLLPRHPQRKSGRAEENSMAIKGMLPREGVSSRGCCMGDAVGLCVPPARAFRIVLANLNKDAMAVET